jgi:DNA-binding XRE family transcriptional regulator
LYGFYCILYGLPGGLEMNGDLTDLPQRIKRYRRSVGENQTEFGKRFGVQRLTVTKWEKGTRPNSDHLPQLTQLLSDREAAQGESLTYQLLLPFDQPINLELRVSAQKADTIHFEARLRRKVS